MKKTISVLIAAFAAVSALSSSVYAVDLDVPVEEEIIEEYAYFDTLESSLTFSGSTATCTSIAGASSGKSITATQYLEKYSGWFWSWDTVATWSKTENGPLLTMTNQTSLSSGKYRLRTVFTVTSTTGQEETQTAYSFERTVS